MAPSLHTDYNVPLTNQKVPDTHPKNARLLLHTISTAVMANGFLGMTRLKVADAISPQYGGFFQYLTILGLAISGATTITSALSDVLPAVKGVKSMKRAFLLIALPVEIAISAIYWPLILLAPGLMLPQSSASGVPTSETPGGAASPFFIPLWMDLSMHAVPAAVLLFDFFFFEKKYTPPVSTTFAFLLTAIFGTGYSVWVEHCAAINHRFPYPFLNIAFAGRLAIYVTASMGALGVFRLLNGLHR